MAPMFGLLVQRSPLAAAGVAALGATAATALASPGFFIAAVGTITTAVPKAGIVVSGFPVPAAMFLLLGAALLLRWRSGPSRSGRPGTRIAVIALVWLGFRLVALRLDGGSVGDMLALAGWYGLPIVLLLVGPALGSLRGALAVGWTHRLESGLLLACGFSALQQLLGIERSVVPGITRAVGADYTAKPLQFPGGTKIPSTYQNGNIFGVITAFFFLVAAERVLGGRGRPRDRLIMGATAVASVLSGSRTILIGLVVGLAVLVARSGLDHRTVAVIGLAGVVFLGVLQISPALSDRLTGTRASDPAFEGRTVVWGKIARQTPLAELVVGGPVWAQRRLDPGLAEGAPGAVQQVGLFGVILFAGTFLAATSSPELRRWRVVLIPVVVSAVIDSAYLVFPTLFIPLARMFAPLAADLDEDPGGADETSGPASSEASGPAPVTA